MSKLASIVVTAAVCLPLGALLKNASADHVSPAYVGNRVFLIEGHRHLSRAQAALHEALDELNTSEQRHELLWSDRTGRAAETKAAVESAVRSLDGTADWVRSGLAQEGLMSPPVFYGRRVLPASTTP